MEKLTESEKIIKNAVAKAYSSFQSNYVDRKDVAEKALLLADEKGVNIQTSAHWQDFFHEILDNYFS